MINERNVIRMRVPYPSISSDLAVQAHMYICRTSAHPKYAFVKCQTLKPYMLVNNPIKHFIDEKPDSTRNPFSRTTRIDCDKLFSTEKVNYSDALLTSSRCDICQELHDNIVTELEADGWADVPIDNETELIKLNPLITLIE